MNLSSAKQWISLALLVVAIHSAFLLIVIPAISHRVTPLYNQDVIADGYDQIAENLVAGYGYRLDPDTAKTLIREPGYPVFLAGLFVLFGKTFTPVKLANMLLAFATAGMMMQLAGRIWASPILRIVPALLFLFHPGTLIAESRGGIESLFTCLVVLFFVVVYAALDSNKWSHYLLAGSVLGLVVLVRSTPILFPLFLLAYLLIVEKPGISKLSPIRSIFLMILAMLAVLSPWIIRNYSLTKRFIPTASVLGLSAHAGQYICMHFSEPQPWVMLDRAAARERVDLARQQGYSFRDDIYYLGFYSTSDELAFSSYLTQRVFREYKEHPLLCAECVAHNLFNFWFAGKSWRSTALNTAVQLPYLLLAIVGSVLCARKKQFKRIGPMVLFIGYMVLVSLPILAQARYSVPLVPFVAILGTFVLATLGEKSSRLIRVKVVPSGRSIQAAEPGISEHVSSDGTGL